MRFLLFTYSIILSSFSFTNGIEKGYEALEIYNYFEAKNQFEKNLKKDSLACSYGLAVIHFRTDNPFSNKEIALEYFEIFWRNFGQADEKQIGYLGKLGIRPETIDTLKNGISAYYFKEAAERESYTPFLRRFKWANEYDTAVFLLDEVNFNLALENDDAEAWRKFLGFYPKSVFYKEALKRYQKRLYEEQTERQTVNSYDLFIENFPENPHVDQAEDEIYHLMTSDHSLTSLEYFIRSYPRNRNLYDAWRRLYLEFMTDLSEERYLSFKENYPDYPFMGDLEVEFKLSKIEYLPYKKYDQWGFIDTVGFVRIPPKYETVERFKEGLAVVSNQEKYGAINKKGDLIIPLKYDELYDFNEGTAVCALGDFYGMVNIAGEEVLKLEYDDVSEMQNGLAIAEKEGKFGFYDRNGFEKIEAVYEEVQNFEEGLAIVSKEGMFGIIDPFGITVLPFRYDNLIRFNEQYFAAETEDGWGIITLEQDTILDFEMDLIEPVHEGFAYFELDGEFGFLNGNGRIAIEAEFTVFADDKHLCYFKNGHALVKSGDRFGLIDEKGKRVIPTLFFGIGFFDDLIPISKGELWGYCDGKANRKIDYQYQMALNFNGDFAIATQEDKMGLINKIG
ncbi:MAG: WG repeat-containing protein, partial [Crocinitomicaceae bacterium]